VIHPSSPLHQSAEAAAYLFGALAGARVAFVLTIDLAWERAGRHPLNQLARDVLQTAVYAVSGFAALRAAGIQPSSLIATGTVVTAIVGLSLQDTLGNLAAGMAIQIDQPIALGDWVRIDKGDVTGRVVSTNWRSITIQGDDRLLLVVPNGVFGRTPFVNFSRPGGSCRRSAYFTIPYEVPPNRVQEAVLAACADMPNILVDPAPSVLTWAFLDHGVQYWLRFYIADFALRDKIQGELQTRMWFHLRRRKIDFAVPLRKSFVHEIDQETIASANAEVVRDRRAAIDAVDFLGPLSSDAKDMLARRAHRKLFGAGETIIRVGDKGREFYLVRRGSVAVRAADRDVALLGAGDFFGELALLTGKERHANVIAREETEVIEIDEKMFQDVLEREPKIAEEISKIVAQRQSELEARLSGVPPTDSHMKSATTEILSKIKSLFGLD
jgi:small-conductance mechanosensitive channel/CRP-like cAMP-binding protein